MMKYVECRTLFNETKRVPADTLLQRPSVYGLVIHDDQLLVAKARSTQKYVLPGGGIERGEAIDAALIREVWEETGIQVEVGAFLHFHTDLFYYDPMAMAIHGFMFYYACTPLTTVLDPPPYPPEEDIDLPMWVRIDALRAGDFQAHGEILLKLIAACRASVERH